MDDEEGKNMSDIDNGLRTLQTNLVDLKGELSYMAEGNYAEKKSSDGTDVPTKFSDEGEPTIPGLFHMVSKANIHANHCLELIHKIRGSEPQHVITDRG